MIKFTDEEIKMLKEEAKNCILNTTSHIDPKKFESKEGDKMSVKGN